MRRERVHARDRARERELTFLWSGRASRRAAREQREREQTKEKNSNRSKVR